MAESTSYNDAYNPFSDDRKDESLPDFSHSRVVLDTPSNVFDMTEFPIYFDEGLTFRQMMEQSLGPSETSVATQTTPPRPTIAAPMSDNSSTAYDSQRGLSFRKMMEQSHGSSATGAINNPRISVDSQERTGANESTPVLCQPRREDVRRNIPVYTLGWSSTSNPQMIPATGLDFLTGVHEVLLQQTVTNLSTPNTSAKRYIIKVPNGETLYTTSENSTEAGRMCCGSQRSFSMSVLDPTQQEAAVLTRSTGCVFGWCPGLLQSILVYTPGSMFLGSVQQDYSFAHVSYTIRDNGNEDLFRVFGPMDGGVWAMPMDAVFTICGGRGGGRLGVIARKWNNSLGDYHLQVLFPASGTPDEHKMLIVTAAILIEYMFYEHRNTSAIRFC